MLPSREFHSQIKSSLLIFHSVMNVITDVMTLCLPIGFVVRLQTKTARKLQVLGALILGGM